ncbi:MAG: hypothetical protein ACLQVL_28275 [Terriglobia bacterium]
MPTEPPRHPRADYTPEALAACEKALRTILTKVGPWGQRLVLIGGMTPRYLVGRLPVDAKEHIGTTDLDIVVGVTISTEEEEAYRNLQKNLLDAQFAPARNPDTGQEQTFRWARQVDGVGVHLEFFCPVGTGQPGKLLRNPGSNVGSRISAIRTRGAELAAMDNVVISLAGELLDRGGIQEAVSARVANLLPFLVLKAFAIEERDKAKDSYDVVWTLSSYKDGPRSVVQEIAKSPVLGHPDVAAAMDRLRTHFQTPDHRGPAQYANFELMAGDEDERVRLRRYAHGTLADFFRHWKELLLPG